MSELILSLRGCNLVFVIVKSLLLRSFLGEVNSSCSEADERQITGVFNNDKLCVELRKRNASQMLKVHT